MKRTQGEGGFAALTEVDLAAMQRNQRSWQWHASSPALSGNSCAPNPATKRRANWFCKRVEAVRGRLAAVEIGAGNCEIGVMSLFLSSLPGSRLSSSDGQNAADRIRWSALSSSLPRRSAGSDFPRYEDREIFLETLSETCRRNGWRVHAYVLLSNHYHLLVETPKGNLVRGMHWFQATYTTRYNRRHGLSGHLFAGRYKSLLIDPEERAYLVTVSDYIHLNPARAHLKGEKPLGDYRWSSLPWYGQRAGDRPGWLEVKTVLGELGWTDRASDRRKYLERMEARAQEEASGGNLDPRPSELRRGWILGGDAISRSGSGINGSIERGRRAQVRPGGNLGRSWGVERRASPARRSGAVEPSERGPGQTQKE